MDRISFFEDRHGYHLNSTQLYFAKAMLTAGATESEVLAAVGGYSGGSKNKAGLMVCPRCGGTMKVVALVSGRRGRYCPNDRVCLPLEIK
jgi:hypothetical protein